jgi:hypothetical protein
MLDRSKFAAKVEDIRRRHVDPPARATVKFG